MDHLFGGDKGVNVLIGSATANLACCVVTVDFCAANNILLMTESGFITQHFAKLRMSGFANDGRILGNILSGWSC